MEQTWRWFGPDDPISLADIRQTGATGVVTALHEVPDGEPWTADAIAERKELIEESGLSWSVVESVPVHEDIKRDGPLRDRWVAAYQESLRNLAPLGLGPAHAGLIRAVGATPGRSQQALATQLGILASRLVVLIDELEGDGLIERRRDPADRRYYALHLTSDGDERLRDIGRVAQSHGEDFLAPLNGQDRADLTRLLTRVAAHHSLTPGVHPGHRTIGRDTELRG